jgi:hypothetical protein
LCLFGCGYKIGFTLLTELLRRTVTNRLRVKFPFHHELIIVALAVVVLVTIALFLLLDNSALFLLLAE